MDATNPRIIEHCKQGNLAIYLENDVIIIQEDAKKTHIGNILDIPLADFGNLECMKQNILPAVLVAWLSQMSSDFIIQKLKNFLPSPENNPGRMNIFSLKNCSPSSSKPLIQGSHFLAA